MSELTPPTFPAPEPTPEQIAARAEEALRKEEETAASMAEMRRHIEAALALPEDVDNETLLEALRPLRRILQSESGHCASRRIIRDETMKVFASRFKDRILGLAESGLFKETGGAGA